jgi:hypothetical protein
MRKIISMNGRLRNIHRGSPLFTAHRIPKTDSTTTLRTTAAIVDQRSRAPSVAGK